MTKKKNKKGFTLIELLAVIVILAVLALIAIPIVINIISDSRENAHKRSIQSYGRTIENAIAQWQSKNDGQPPTDIGSYKIEISGEKVECDNLIQGLDGDEGITLTGCHIIDKNGNKSPKSYRYHNGQVYLEGEDNDTNPSVNYAVYSVGDTFTIHGDSYHVIVDSDADQDYVVALKDNSLTATEIMSAGGTVSSNENQVARMVYGTDSTYTISAIKSVVDNWASSKFVNNELKTVDGYSARLITLDEMQSNLDFNDEPDYPAPGVIRYRGNNSSLSWLYLDFYSWTMTKVDNSSNFWTYRDNYVYNNIGNACVRPVINIYKSAIPNQ